MSPLSVRRGWERRALACSVLALLCPSALAQLPAPRNPQEPKNLALNGSFENPAVGKAQRLLSARAWSARRGAIELVNDGAITSTQTGTMLVYDSGPLAVDGHQYLGLNSLAIVGQTCATKAGQDYALSFAYSARRGGPEVRFEVWFGGTLRDSILVPGKSAEGWIRKSYLVVGASSRDELELRCLSANSIGVLIDACALIPFDPASSAELLRNGDFEDDPHIPPGTSLETPVYIGWSSGRHYDIRIENMGTATSFAGPNVLHVRERRASFQQVYVVPLRSYQLRFAYSPNPRDDRDRTFTVSFDGQILETLFVRRSATLAWATRTYAVSARGPLTTLEFKDSSDGPTGCLVDGVSLVGPVPEPETAGQVAGQWFVTRGDGGLVLNPEAMFARGITSLGDLDGNGVQDLAVGSVGDDDGADNAGAVWILFLNADRTVRSCAKISELHGGLVADLQKDDGFGRALSSLGDLDGDGVADLAVGANEDDTGAWNAGAVFVLFLRRDGSVRAHHKITALSGDVLDYVPVYESNFGAALAGMGDVDGDGIRDMAVGSRYGDSVMVCFLRRDGTVRASRNITYGRNGFTDTVTSVSDFFGMSCASMGDFDVDGVNDLLVGAFGRRVNFQNYVGGQYLMLLRRDGTVKKWFYYGTENMNVRTQTLAINYNLGTACAGLGDVDGDGVRDIAVGAQREGALSGLEREETTNQGAVYVLLLNANGTIKTCQRLGDRAGGFDLSIQNGTRWGEALAPLGDFDGDGLVDMTVGSRFVQGTGAVYFCELLGGEREPLLANFGAAPTSGSAPLDVQFTDRSTGPVTEWLWEFGDGGTSSERSPSHSYAAVGKYPVRLTVRGSGGATHVKTQSDFIDVTGGGLPDGVTRLGCGVNPPASFRILSGGPRIGTTITFGVDNPLGTQALGSIPLIGASWTASPKTPCGTLQPGQGMTAPGTSGELLIAPPLAFTRQGSAWTGPGNPAPVTYPIPNSTSLIGRTLYVQGRMQDGSAGAAIPIGLADGFALTFRP